MIILRRRLQTDLIAEADRSDPFGPPFGGKLLTESLQLLRILPTHIDVAAEQAIDRSIIALSGRQSGRAHQLQKFAERCRILCIFRLSRERAPVNQRAFGGPAMDRMFFEKIDQLVEHFVRRPNALRVTAVGIVSQRNIIGKILKAPNCFLFSTARVDCKFQIIAHWSILFDAKLPLSVIERIQQTANLNPIARRPWIGRNSFAFPISLMDPIGRVFGPIRDVQSNWRGIGRRVQLQVEIASLGQ